jgi:GH15 family glucan-1,4-alpha-glucosidase
VLVDRRRGRNANDRLSALVQLATPLGLFAEEMDPTSLDHLGNYPQALTHAALIQAALALRDAQALPAPQGTTIDGS